MSILQQDTAIVMERLRENLQSCIIGKSWEIELLLTALLAGGHVLLEDVPGTGKTVLMKALAKSIQCEYRRIQCNPDLLPTDITGVSIYDMKKQDFAYRPGPIMTNIMLADEINRTTTKTQSALLEAMEEGHVTVDGVQYVLPRPFLMLATQNPIDFEGTYTLPEAQLDRFMMKFTMGYPDEASENSMIFAQAASHPIDALQPVARSADILELQMRVKEVHMDQKVAEYLVSIVRQTREHAQIFLGASPRATMSLVQAVKASAFLQGRHHVLPDDIKKMAPYVLGHRLLLQAEARMEGNTAASLLQGILQEIPAPVGR